MFKQLLVYFVATLIGALFILFVFDCAYTVQYGTELHFQDLGHYAPSYRDFIHGLERCGTMDILLVRLLILASSHLLAFAVLVSREVFGRRAVERGFDWKAFVTSWFYVGGMFFIAFAGWVAFVDTHPIICGNVLDYFPLPANF